MEKQKLTIFFLILTLAFTGCKTVVEEKKEDSIKVMVTQAQEFSYNQRITASGRITSKDEMRLSFKTGGIISSILVNEGDVVK